MTTDTPADDVLLLLRAAARAWADNNPDDAHRLTFAAWRIADPAPHPEDYDR